ncbi:MAG TPA: class I SAM-dependent methyltransferase [Candidatus Acidoferrales bacterium]|nr:class I SAM-dependent methyltransferase [Candidatus Acidoferrales bacterium]
MHEVQRTRAYLPAAGKDWALPFYDPMVKLLGGDAARRQLLDQASLAPEQRVLDIGCGTGTLVALIKRLYPAVDVVGLDPDPKALARAKTKSASAGASIQLDHGFSDELPYPDASFDRVFSSFMFHHLEAESREQTVREVRRVLKPGGSFHLADFVHAGKHGHGLSHRIQSHSHFKDNSDERILSLMAQAGFARPRKAGDKTMMFGLLHVAYYAASI